MATAKPAGHDEELLPLIQLAQEFGWGERMLIDYAHVGKFAAKFVDGVWYSTRRAMNEFTLADEQSRKSRPVVVAKHADQKNVIKRR
jgi:hypothetical protein